jgi:protein SOK2
MEAKRGGPKLNDRPSAGSMQSPAGAPALHHHHSMGSQMSSQISHAPIPNGSQIGMARPVLERAHTFPTPPTSASSVSLGNSNYNEWGQQTITGVTNSQPLAIDTGLSNARSMPSTPVHTPPGNSLQGVPPYANQQSYDNGRTLHATAQQGQYSGATSMPQNNASRYGTSMSSQYLKSEMGPPARSNTNGAADHGDAVKHDYYSNNQTNGHVEQEEDAHHDQTFNDPTYSNLRNSHNNYNSAVHGDSEQTNGVEHQNGTARTALRAPGSSVPQWAHGYQTPPRGSTSGSLYQNGTENHTAPFPPNMNGSISNKRGREDDDYEKARPGSGGMDDSLKRYKTGAETTIGAPSTHGFDENGRPMSRSKTIIRGNRR